MIRGFVERERERERDLGKHKRLYNGDKERWS